MFSNNVGRTHEKQLQWLFKNRNGKVRSVQMLNNSEKETVTSMCKSCKRTAYSKKLKGTKYNNINMINIMTGIQQVPGK